jgi:hypothetical protein
MSKQSYLRGFCKAASAHGVDPGALSEFVQKQAQTPALDSFARWADKQPAAKISTPKAPVAKPTIAPPTGQVAQTAQAPAVKKTIHKTWTGVPGSASQPQWAANALSRVESARRKAMLARIAASGTNGK